MKVSILFDFKAGAWGGGNQFLKALRGVWNNKGIYTEKTDEAGIVLFNSFPFGKEITEIKELFRLKNKGKILIHRVDGPITGLRGKDFLVDRIIYQLNNIFASATIFQSQWSRQANYKSGLKQKKYETIIANAPDPQIFNIKDKINFAQGRKVRLITTSWSANWRKGFGIYQYLDKNLDFSRYEMTFIGNSPVRFGNIKQVSPLSSVELASQLKQHDIFITASQKDPCSNSLLEALACGLPAVVLNDGGHPELIQKGGELFNDEKDVLEKIEQVASNYQFYQALVSKYSLAVVAEQYYQFAEKVFKDNNKSKSIVKKLDLFVKFYYLLLLFLFWKLKNKVIQILNKIWRR